ncbi:MAG: hypothetical protein R2875_02420 [Desulfobacterales bacterium]
MLSSGMLDSEKAATAVICESGTAPTSGTLKSISPDAPDIFEAGRG